jgi:hypothetical protein
MALQLSPALPARIVKAVALLAGLAMLAGFETSSRVDMRIIKPLPRSFRLAAVEGSITPSEAQFRRSGNTYVNESPTATGRNLLAASWFAVHPTDAEAVLFEYPATDAAGSTVYRLDYAVEEDRNRFRLYELDQARFVAALDHLESSVRRNDASFRERRFYEDLTSIWNLHASRAGEAPGTPFYVTGLEEINTLIAYSRRLPDGQKIITSTGVLVEAYVR